MTNKNAKGKGDNKKRERRSGQIQQDNSRESKEGGEGKRTQMYYFWYRVHNHVIVSSSSNS